MKRMKFLLLIVSVLFLCQGQKSQAMCPNHSVTPTMHALLEGRLVMPPLLNPETKKPIKVYLESSTWTQQVAALTAACFREKSALPLWQFEQEQLAQGGTMEQWFLSRMQAYPHQTQDPDEADVIVLKAPLTLASQLRTLHYRYGHGAAGDWQSLIQFLAAHSYAEMAALRHQVFCRNHHKVLLFMAFWSEPWPDLLDSAMFAAFSNRFGGLHADREFISVPSTSNADLVQAYLARDCLHNHTKRFDIFFSCATRSNKGGQLRAMLASIDWQQHFPGSVVVVDPNKPFDLLSSQEAAARSRQYVDNIINARFCLIVQGDSPDCRRLFEAVLAGCVPILYSDWADWLPFNWLPDLWTADTLLHIDTSLNSTETFLPRLHQLIDSIDPQRLAHMQAALRRILPDILWGLGPPHAEHALMGRASDHLLAEAARRIRENPLPLPAQLAFCKTFEDLYFNQTI